MSEPEHEMRTSIAERLIAIESKVDVACRDIKLLSTEVVEVKRRLFIDNGETSHQTSISKLKSGMCLMMWLLAAVGTATVFNLIALIFKHFFRAS